MTKPLTFQQAAASAKACGYELIKYAGSSNAYGSVFRCGCGREWSTKHNNVVSANKTGCPDCARKAARFDEKAIRQALRTNGHELVSLRLPMRGQNTQVEARCEHGHLRTARLGTIIYAKKPCPDCSKIRRGVDFDGFNRRLAPHGYRLVEWGGTTRTEGTFECSCGASWRARVSSVLREQSHCPGCFEGGFHGDEPAVFYLYEMRQGRKLRYGYGISGRFESRDAEHRRNAKAAGWKISLCRLYEVDRGVKALETEKKLKETFVPAKDVFYGFITESFMPRDLTKFLHLLNSLI